MERLQWRDKSIPWLAVLAALIVLVGGTTGGVLLYQQSQQPRHVPLDEWLAESKDESEQLCRDGIGWIEADEHVGETTNIYGTVKRVSEPVGVSGDPTFLEIGNPYPNPNRLNAVIWGQDADSFGGDLDGQFEGETVCLNGTIEEYQGVPQVTLRDPDDIALESDTPDAESDAEYECITEDVDGTCLDGEIYGEFDAEQQEYEEYLEEQQDSYDDYGPGPY